MISEEKIPNEVCHYTKKNTALEKILREKKIKFGLLGLTNDPKESKMRQVNLISIGRMYYDRDLEPKVKEESYRIISSEWKVLCMTQSSEARKFKNPNKNEIMSRFRHGYNRPRMWAQYAENHSGVCLIFDGKKLHTNISSSLDETSQLFKGAVNYENFSAFVSRPMESFDLLIKSRDPIKFTETIRAHYLLHYEHYFLSKYPDWQGESEFRWLIHNTSFDPIYVDIEDALKGVIVGSDFLTEDEATIVSICKELRVDVGKMEWVNGLPEPALNCFYSSSKE